MAVSVHLTLTNIVNTSNEVHTLSSIQVIEKQQRGWGRKSRWPLDMWELILELLVKGTSPVSINANIIVFVNIFSPNVIIKEFPSIWTIQRACTIFLVVVQTFFDIQAGQSKHMHQLFIDVTSHQQIMYHYFVISIKEDVTFKLVLMSTFRCKGALACKKFLFYFIDDFY